MKTSEATALAIGLGAAGVGLLLFASSKPSKPTGDNTMHGTIPAPTTDDDIVARQRVINYAASQLGATDPSPYWLDAYGTVPEPGKFAWCGVFALWALRSAGLTNWKWISGIGFIYLDANGHRSATPRLPIVTTPAMGDIAYFDKPYQHYALVEEVEGDTVHLIAGNTPNVSRSNPLLSKATAYFSIAPLLPSARA